jgi:hypothetical protein
MRQESQARVVRLDRLAFAYAPQPWTFAQMRRVEIDAHFRELQRAKPALWNGRVLLLSEYALAGATLRGRFFDTDYASFLAWRDWGFPDAAVGNCFAQGVLTAADGAFLLGVMGEHTANAGRVYFPGGTPDPDDVRDGMVDLAGSVTREVLEETGLAPADLAADAGWHAVLAGPRIALMKIMRTPLAAEVLRERVRAHIAAETAPELADLHIVRGARDLDSRIPDFVVAFIRYCWAGDAG